MSRTKPTLGSSSNKSMACIPSEPFGGFEAEAEVCLLHFKPEIGPSDFRVPVNFYDGPDVFSTLPIELLFAIRAFAPTSCIGNVLRCVSKQLLATFPKDRHRLMTPWGCDRLQVVNSNLGLGRFTTEDAFIDGLYPVRKLGNGKTCIGFRWASRSDDPLIARAIRERCALLRIPVPSQFCRTNIAYKCVNPFSNEKVPCIRIERPRPQLPLLSILSFAEEKKMKKLLQAERKKTWKYEKPSYRR